jgi:hypothetical protein
MMALALVVAVVGQAPAVAFAVAIRKDGSPFKRSFWS